MGIWLRLLPKVERVIKKSFSLRKKTQGIRNNLKSWKKTLI